MQNHRLNNKQRKYKHNWSGIVRQGIRDYYLLKEDDSVQAVLFTNAVDKAMDMLQRSPDGNWKSTIVTMRFFDGYDVDFIADTMFSNERTVRRICDIFVELVAEHAGFKPM